MSKQEMSKDDSFDRLYKASARFFTHPRFFAGMTVVIGLFALLVTELNPPQAMGLKPQ